MTHAPPQSLVVNFTPTGMVPTKAATPHVPVSPTEIVEQVHEAYEIGISVVHLHARRADGSPGYEPEIYADIFAGIRRHCPDLPLCASLSGRSFLSSKSGRPFWSCGPTWRRSHSDRSTSPAKRA